MTIRRITWLLCLISIMAANVASASDHDSGVRHYLSLGTSLSVGVQPDVTGANQVTEEGYADQLHDIVAPGFRKLKLTKLGCPGETTETMINGGKCEYQEGSQLAQAVEFLHAQQGKCSDCDYRRGRQRRPVGELYRRGDELRKRCLPVKRIQ